MYTPSSESPSNQLQVLTSFRDFENDTARCSAIKNSKKHTMWYCVTFDGIKWESYAHLPSEYVQAVCFMNGKKESVSNYQHKIGG